MLLKQRLDCVPNYYNKVADSNMNLNEPVNNKLDKNEIDFKMLLDHFIEVQKKHKFFKKTSRLMN